MKILFPEGTNKKIIEAAKTNIGINYEPILFDGSFKKTIDYDKLANRLFELRSHKGMTLEMAKEEVKDNVVASLLILEMGHIDGVIGGIDRTTAHIVSNAFKIIGTKNGVGSSLFVMEKGGDKFVFTDCAVIANPSSDQLVEIAQLASDFSREALRNNPEVSFLSFATNDSAKSDEVSKVKAASEKFGGQGPIQFDAAVNEEIGVKKYGDEWKPTNVFVFPTLDSGNIGYKIASQLGGYKAAGPILVGLNKIVNDLSRGSSVEEIIEVIKYTLIQIGGFHV